MPLWSIFIPIAALVVPLAERFYTRFYPEPETQKRHLKTAARWVIDCGAIGISVWGLIQLSHEPMPTTTKQVLAIAIAVSITVGNIVFLLSSRLFRSVLRLMRDHVGLTAEVARQQFDHTAEVARQQFDHTTKHLDATSRILQILRVHEEVLMLIAASDTLALEEKEEMVKILSRPIEGLELDRAK